MAKWLDGSRHGMQVGLGPHMFALPPKGPAPHPIFSPYLLWPNEWMVKMKLGMQVGLGPDHIVLDGDPAPLPQRVTAPQFLAHICCGQVAGWIQMPLGRKVGLNPSDTVLDGDPAPPPQKKQSVQRPQFSAHVYCGQTAG